MTTSAPPGRTGARWAALPGFLLAVAVAAGLGGWAAGSAPETYRELELPGFAPPSWLFGPVWTVLYVAIAVAAWLVWRRDGWTRSLTLWVVQLVLNAAWTPLFFGLGLIGWALVDIVVLLVAVAVTTALFRRTSTAAALLLVPYLAWVGFATLLNAAIWQLN
ncbi:TspO/MBR family protein [Nocardioides coralli]|uniref:TspO/MBR family protein n=1 Tax=Nocardioides coralli TaxID=2872154 RepID=UPI001CA3A314|nr:TspO/MBR family protein [Nocardioides coralli]QZY29741.1 tryptophan-rich sensory protein [Nocardioides coralli]